MTGSAFCKLILHFTLCQRTENGVLQLCKKYLFDGGNVCTLYRFMDRLKACLTKTCGIDNLTC